MRWWEIAGLALAVLGVAATIYYGVKAIRPKAARSNDQSQSVTGGGVGIQSGRDTNLK